MNDKSETFRNFISLCPTRVSLSKKILCNANTFLFSLPSPSPLDHVSSFFFIFQPPSLIVSGAILFPLHPQVHKKGVNDLAVHHSGKLALTVGRDECLAMVNLVRGRRSFYHKIGKEASLIKFDGSGEKFFMVTEEKVGIHQAEDAKLLCELDGKKRILCAAPGENGVLLTGGEDRSITAWDTNSGKVAYCIEDAHSARVKGIVVLTKNDGGGTAENPYLVASASSDGIIRVWDVRMAIKEKPLPLAEAKTNSRLTCLAGSSIKSFKRPRIGDSAPKGEEKASTEDS